MTMEAWCLLCSPPLFLSEGQGSVWSTNTATVSPATALQSKEGIQGPQDPTAASHYCPLLRFWTPG
jgi:hypothetical protein